MSPGYYLEVWFQTSKGPFKLKYRGHVGIIQGYIGHGLGFRVSEIRGLHLEAPRKGLQYPGYCLCPNGFLPHLLVIKP